MFGFIVLGFGLCWLLWGCVAPSGLDVNQGLAAGLAYVLGGFGPAIAGLVVARRQLASSPDFRPRLVETRRIRPRWWLVTLLLCPATLIIGTLGPILEEPGRRGYALECLQVRSSMVAPNSAGNVRC